MDSRDNITEARKIAWEYARDWFGLHSRQRMQSVYFFLISISFLFGVLANALSKDQFSLGLGVSLFGVIIVLIFHRLENRVRDLIHAAEEMLKPLEKELVDLLEVPSIAVASRVCSPMPGSWTYSRAFKLLFGSSGLMFILGSLYSAWGIVSKGHLFEPAFYLTMQFAISIVLGLFGFKLLRTKDADLKVGRLGTVRNATFIVLGVLTILIGLCMIIHLVFLQIPWILRTIL